VLVPTPPANVNFWVLCCFTSAFTGRQTAHSMVIMWVCIRGLWRLVHVGSVAPTVKTTLHLWRVITRSCRWADTAGPRASRVTEICTITAECFLNNRQ